MAAITVRRIWSFCFFSPRVLNILTRGAETQSSGSATQPGFGTNLSPGCPPALAKAVFALICNSPSVTKCFPLNTWFCCFPPQCKIRGPSGPGWPRFSFGRETTQHNRGEWTDIQCGAASDRRFTLLNCLFTPYWQLSRGQWHLSFGQIKQLR